MTQNPTHDINFDLENSATVTSRQNAIEFFKLREDGIRIQWDGENEYRFHYPGSSAVMFLPFPHLFEEESPPGMVKLNRGTTTLTLRPKENVIADNGGTLVLDGTVKYQLFILDEIRKTYAEGNSPPPIQMGP